ncbi:MAG: hypothetical protein M3P11_10790 [Actinomycetota bacterium]|nr:hypothetical protein [Actinomycetota bacterium]
MTSRMIDEAGVSRPETDRERTMRLHGEAALSPETYAAEVQRAHDRLVAVRDAHGPEAAQGHRSITPGTRCAVCVGILQMAEALGNDSITDTERVHARLDQLEANVEALGGIIVPLSVRPKDL